MSSEFSTAISNSEVIFMTVPDYTISLLSRDDAALIDATVSLVNLCYRGAGSWTSESSIVKGARITVPQLTTHLCDAEVLVALPSSGGSPIACVKTGRVRDTVCGPLSGTLPAAYCGMLAVRPEMQSAGLGRVMISEVERRARDVHECGRVVMDVLDYRTELIDWYKKLGYVHRGVSVAARPFLEEKDEQLLVECNFVLLEKTF